VFSARREAKDGPKEFDEAQLKDVEVARVRKEMAVGKNFGMNVWAFFKDTVKRVANEGLNGDFVVWRDMMKAFEEGIDPWKRLSNETNDEGAVKIDVVQGVVRKEMGGSVRIFQIEIAPNGMTKEMVAGTAFGENGKMGGRRGRGM